MENLIPVGPAEQTPIPQKSSNFKWLIIILAVLAVGAAAYLLAGSKLFRGELELLTPEQQAAITAANTEMVKVKDYVKVLDNGSEFINWPIETGKESSFEVLENEDIDANAGKHALFWSKKGYGTWRGLYADF